MTMSYSIGYLSNLHGNALIKRFTNKREHKKIHASPMITHCDYVHFREELQALVVAGVNSCARR